MFFYKAMLFFSRYELTLQVSWTESYFFLCVHLGAKGRLFPTGQNTLRQVTEQLSVAYMDCLKNVPVHTIQPDHLLQLNLNLGAAFWFMAPK